MKIGIIKETKIPEDNRVAFTPEQLALLKNRFDIESIVQSSDVRAINNKEYEKEGIKVLDDLSNCDLLFGIKEVDINALIPNKHYFFFGHIAKLQEYNKPLLQKMMELGITFTDYEYLVDEHNHRVVAFGWWAGVVGVYNTIRAWGLKCKTFKLEKPHRSTTLEKMISDLKQIELPNIKIIVTGKGRVSQGAQYMLDQMGVKRIDVKDFLNMDLESISYTVLCLEELVKHENEDVSFNRSDFRKNPQNYVSDFMTYATKAEMLITCHFWGENDPIYLDYKDLKNPDLKIKVIGDVTCDIKGSIKSTIRPSTHENPFYDYNTFTQKEEAPFSSESNITVMAVDTLPNALSIDTSKAFGEQLIEKIIPLLNENINVPMIENATILKKGKITNRYSYLKEFANKI